MLCHSHSRARNNMYIKLIFIAHEHRIIGQIPFENGWPWKYFHGKIALFHFMAYDIQSSFLCNRNILPWPRFLSKMGDRYFSRPNCTFSFHDIWHSKLIFIIQDYFTMDQLSFQNGWPWKCFSRSNCNLFFHGIWHWTLPAKGSFACECVILSDFVDLSRSCALWWR